jgi:hypothetical protein
MEGATLAQLSHVRPTFFFSAGFMSDFHSPLSQKVLGRLLLLQMSHQVRDGTREGTFYCSHPFYQERKTFL